MALERSTARAPRGTSGAALTGLRASPALRGPFGGGGEHRRGRGGHGGDRAAQVDRAGAQPRRPLRVRGPAGGGRLGARVRDRPSRSRACSPSTSSSCPRAHVHAGGHAQNWFALAVYLVDGVVVSELAARARRRATEAEQRERRRRCWPRSPPTLLQGGDVAGRARADRASAPTCSASIGGDRARDGERRAGAERVAASSSRPAARTSARSTSPSAAEPSRRHASRFLPALASLLAVAIDRERLAREAVEAEALPP